MQNKKVYFSYFSAKKHMMWVLIDSSVKSLDHLTDNRHWPFKIANKVIVYVFS